MIKVEMDIRTAAAVRESLFQDTREYTYDPKCCPQRVHDIRGVIVDIDNQIESELKSIEEQGTEE